MSKKKGFLDYLDQDYINSIKPEIKRLYLDENMTVAEVCSALRNVEEKIIRTIIRKYFKKSRSQINICANRNRDKAAVAKKRAETNLKKYGAENVFASEYFKEIMTEDKIAAKLEKTRNTNNEKYGCWSTQAPEIREKNSNSLKKTFSNEEVRYKAANTFKNNHPGLTGTKQLLIISEDVTLLINSKESLEKYLDSIPYEKRVVQDMCNELKVSYSTLYYRIKMFGLMNKVYFPYRPYTSKYEREIYEILGNSNVKLINNCKFSPIEPYELDIYLPDLNIGIEFNGNYWHCDLNKTDFYHYVKSLRGFFHNIFIYNIWECDWLDNHKREIIISDLYNICNITKEVAYEKCSVKIINKNTAISFISENSFRRYTESDIHIGLFLRDNLIYVITFKDNLDRSYEITGTYNKIGYNVKRGFSILYNYFINNFDASMIVSYIDIATNSGSDFINEGFSIENTLDPQYRWVNDYDNISIMYPSDDIDEDYVRSLGYVKMYDCGRFICKKVFS